MLGRFQNVQAAPARASGGPRGDLLGLLEFGELADPATGTRLGAQASLHHDAEEPNYRLSLRGGALRVTTYQFPGTYLSLALDLPPDVRDGLQPGCRLAVDIEAAASRRLTAFVRLNLETPEATDVVHEIMVLHEGQRRAVFGLGEGERVPVSGAWLDVILSHPRMSEVTVSRLQVELERP